jgi:hypothetical protein
VVLVKPRAGTIFYISFLLLDLNKFEWVLVKLRRCFSKTLLRFSETKYGHPAGCIFNWSGGARRGAGHSAVWEDKVWGGRRGAYTFALGKRRLAGGIYWYFYSRGNKERMILCIFCGGVADMDCWTLLWWQVERAFLHHFSGALRDLHIEHTM